MIAILQNIHHHKIRYLTQACLLNTLFVHVPSILYLYVSEEVLHIQFLKVCKKKKKKILLKWLP